METVVVSREVVVASDRYADALPAAPDGAEASVVEWRPVEAAPAALHGALTETERRRASSLRVPADRAAYLAAHCLVRACAGTLLERDPADIVLRQRCPDCGSDRHGKPYLDGHDVVVSLSHTRGFVAAAASFAPVGVDIESADAEVPDDALAPGERGAGGRVPRWVLKECLVKVGAARLDTVASIALPRSDLAVVRWKDWVLRSAVVAEGRAVLGVATPG